MADESYPKILGEKEYKEWIKGCPLQINKTRTEKKSADANVSAVIFTAKCTSTPISHYCAVITYLDSRRTVLGTETLDTLSPSEAEIADTGFNNAVYCSAKITSVTLSDGSVWTNDSDTDGSSLPSQAIYWTTDELYDQIRRECVGTVDAKYKPDTVDGGWRCACGQVNLDSSDTCGECGCSREWLKTHLNEEYLKIRKVEDDAKSEAEIKREIKKRKQKDGISDKTKAIIILASIALIAALIVLTFTQFIPGAKYSKALRLADETEFDEALSILNDLGTFRDAKSKAADVSYRKAQYITGIDEVNVAYSSSSPWFTIDETGLLSFNKDKYEDAGGTWANFIIPDVVDGIVVRELDRNFLLNCKELQVVTISDCVEVIGEQCFYNCEALHTVVFGKNVKKILPRAFINCYALEEIEIPDTIESLGLRVFNNCIALKRVVLGSGIKEIGSYQFSLCVALESVTLKSPITSIGEYAFSECVALKNIFCRFDESEWTEPEIAEGNEAYTNVKISFNQ